MFFQSKKSPRILYLSIILESLKSTMSPSAKVMMNNDWIKSISIDPLECAKKMMVLGKQLRKKETREYES